MSMALKQFCRSLNHPGILEYRLFSVAHKYLKKHFGRLAETEDESLFMKINHRRNTSISTTSLISGVLVICRF